VKCQATTEAGGACKFTARHSGYCDVHHPDPEERTRILSERGRKGGKSYAKNKAKRTVDVSLATAAEIRSYLETLAADALSGRNQAQRITAGRGVAQTAMELLKVTELERENADLLAFIEKHHPDAKPILRAVK
jgi:hypothetical protein